MSKAIDLTNTKIGELTIINLVPEELRRNKYRRSCSSRKSTRENRNSSSSN